jgi:cyclase
MMKKLFSLFILMSLSAAAVFAHGDDSHFENKQDVAVKTTKVAGNVYLLQGRGGNIGALVGPEGILLVDDDYKSVSEKLAAALKELGSEKPRFIFNTHWHGDHTEGNLFFGKDSIVFAHINVRKRLSQVNKIFGEEVQPYPSYAWPMVTYSDSISMHFNGEDVQAVHYPNGHTDGDTVIFFIKSNVVHLGDDFFVGRFPFVDLESGGSVQGLIANIGALLRRIPEDAKLIPGHGALSSVADLKTYHRVLTETSDIVRKAMKKKKTLDEIKKAGLPDEYKEFGSGFIKTDAWIETVYKSYSQK